MFNSRNRGRGKTFSLLLLFTECCTTVVCKLCITYAKYDRCHTISCMQVIIHLALEKKTIGVLKTSATCQIRKKQLTNDKCMTETMWFQLFSEINRISHSANMVGQNVPRSRTLCSELSLNIPGNRWSQSWKDTSVCLSVCHSDVLHESLHCDRLLMTQACYSEGLPIHS